MFSHVPLCTPRAPLMGSSGQEHWSGLPCSPPGDLPTRDQEPLSPTLPGAFFTTVPSGKPGNPPTPTPKNKQVTVDYARAGPGGTPPSGRQWGLAGLILKLNKSNCVPCGRLAVWKDQ